MLRGHGLDDSLAGVASVAVRDGESSLHGEGKHIEELFTHLLQFLANTVPGIGENDVQMTFFLMNDRGNIHHLFLAGNIDNNGAGVRANLFNRLSSSALHSCRRDR